MSRLTIVLMLASTCIAFGDETEVRIVDAGFNVVVGKLTYVESITLDDLAGATGNEVSPDGRFLYSAAYRAASIGAFQRDPDTGALSRTQMLTSSHDFAGVTDVRLSRDGRYAVAASCHASTVALFERDPISGELILLDLVREGQDGVEGIRWAVDVAISPYTKFIYVADPRGTLRHDATQDEHPGVITVFRVTNSEKLEWVESFSGEGRCFDNIRGVILHPDGKSLYATCSDANTLVVLDRDQETGKLSVRQIIRDEENGVHGLRGVMTADVSPDGRFVYTVGGMHGGDNAIGTYRLGSDGRLSLVDEIFNGTDRLRQFTGGNEIAVSPDGLSVYASGTMSGSVACFARDVETGRLTTIETIRMSADVPLLGANCIACSPDGRFVYVTTEFIKGITVFRRLTLCAGVTTHARADEEAADVSGSWKLAIQVDDVTSMTAIVDLSKNEEGYGGHFNLENGMAEADLAEVSVDGTSLSFKVEADMQGQALIAEFKGKIEGEEFTGSVDYNLAGELGTLDVTGERMPVVAE